MFMVVVVVVVVVEKLELELEISKMRGPRDLGLIYHIYVLRG